MTNEQREAIDKLTNGEKMDFVTLVRTFKKEGIEKFAVVRKEYLDTVLSLIKEQEKQIDLMAFNLADYVMYYEYDKCRNPEMIKNKAEEIKQYFERKVEDVKD